MVLLVAVTLVLQLNSISDTVGLAAAVTGSDSVAVYASAASADVDTGRFATEYLIRCHANFICFDVDPDILVPDPIP